MTSRTNKRTGRKKVGREIGKILLSVIICAAGVAMIFPFLWMVSASFKGINDVFEFPIRWIPNPVSTKGYELLFSGKVPFSVFYKNSVIVAVLGLIGTFFSCTLAGYSYAKINFYGRDKIFLVKLSSTMIPSMVTILPTFMIYSALGLVNTRAALWIPWFLGGAMGVFIMRQFFVSLPNELIEAARIDGASHPGIYWNIALPSSRAAISTLLFLYFISIWNDYERPLLYLRSRELFTLPFAVKYFADDQFQNYPAIMAANVCMLIPIMVLFFVFQKSFVQSIVTTGIKG
ncbi:MAG: carbohydrate ABC transporter permease [Caldicoprobacterales bacterium]|jgi:multiple sugar transport system permease protein|nr:carbohydrate ABC transporter permease [Clostridiales bacterium]